jgi:hypothetical protein
MVMAADRPYGEFYGFYSFIPKYFGYTIVYSNTIVLIETEFIPLESEQF